MSATARADAPIGTHRSGLLVRDGSVTGLWSIADPVRKPGGWAPCLHVLARTGNGRLAGDVVSAPPDQDPVVLAERCLEVAWDDGADGDRRRGWGVARTFDEARRLAAVRPVGDPDPAVPERRTRAATHARAFLATLDPQALALAERFDDASAEVRAAVLGRWHAFDRTFDAASPLAPLLAARPEVAASVVAAWDAGHGVADGLDDTLARRWESQGALPRRLAPHVRTAARVLDALGDYAAMLSDVAHMRPDPAVALAGLLAPFPHDWIPRTPAQWDAFGALSPVLALARRMVPDGHPLATLVDVGGDWEGYELRLGRAVTGGPRCEAVSLLAAMTCLEDVSLAYASQVLLPAARVAGVGVAHPDLPAAASRMLLSSRGLVRALETSRRWHQDEGRILRAIRALSPKPAATPGWAACYPDHVEGGTTLTVLTDADELADEGARGDDADGVRGLSHCVGGYAPPCRAGASRVASVRRDGRRTSTVEFRTDAEGRPSVRQHVGARNAAPPLEDVGFVARYLDLVRSGALPFDRTGLTHVVTAWGHQRVDDGYDPLVPGRWEAVRDLWAPHVPRRLRALGAHELAATLLRELGRGGHAWSPDSVEVV